MARSRRMLAVGMTLLLVLAVGLTGCGATNNETPAVGQTDSNEGKTRVVKGEFGDVTIPVKPNKVAGIYVEDYLQALGVTPVVQWYHPNWGKQDYLGLNVPTFDTTGSIEPLVAAGPDLIIVDGGADVAKYELYSKVAPTYRLPEAVLQSPPEILRKIADVLGIPEKVESVLAEYNQKMTDAKAKLDKAVGEQTVAVVRINVGDKSLALFGINNRYTGNIYSELGLAPHRFVKEMKEFQAVLSEEKLPELDADHLIVFPSNGSWTSEENKEAVKLLDSPLWKSLPAVKNGHVYKAERTHWQSGAITANKMKTDDVLKWLVK
ncbi:ABC transporter substrate-binding protein [Paenibacillus oceani]|uniref:ABC transporter substrate-binding protein n=1 Tax=Paenibacillus oceani TaxID=2772510 RepID=A0A927C3U4_9BACL|nr:ABC transporter substrate-binding protein [Paenibacillus oceani]MBD2860818.1 ABC transporter substrate-binding protein [Paenibacillus oceani]